MALYVTASVARITTGPRACGARSARATVVVLGAVALGACAAAQDKHPRPVVLATTCQVTHRLESGGDALDTRIDRTDDTWLLTLNLRVGLGANTPTAQVRGLARVTVVAGHVRCTVLDAGGEAGAARFNAELCTDEVEALMDVVQRAGQDAQPGETVERTIRLRRSQRRTPHGSVSAPAPLPETALVTRDAQGRVVRVVRNGDHGTHEELVVSYPADVAGRCLPDL